MCDTCHDTGRHQITHPEWGLVGADCPHGCFEQRMAEFNAGLTQDQVLARFGARASGCSIVEPHQIGHRTVLTGGGQ